MTSETSTILDRIVAEKREDLARRQREAFRHAALADAPMPPARPLAAAL
jgi:hypothetical protein